MTYSIGNYLDDTKESEEKIVSETYYENCKGLLEESGWVFDERFTDSMGVRLVRLQRK